MAEPCARCTHRHPEERHARSHPGRRGGPRRLDTLRYLCALLRCGFSYNLGGVLSGAAASLIVTALAENYRPSVRGWFMSAMALLSLVCILALPETRERDLDRV
ncbi:hypothetical protein ACTMUQ_13240 [Streptomyces sp. SD11]|uniref:hypothetical protein n=1 Tax=Streptomyces sp. SD11 TaxID=3452209 RepID=UPI003F89A808